MFNKKYKRLIKKIENRISDYKELYKFWKNRDDDETAQMYLARGAALIEILKDEES